MFELIRIPFSLLKLNANYLHLNLIECLTFERFFKENFFFLKLIHYLKRGGHKKMNHFQVKSILSILLILATCTLLHVNCSGVNGSNDLKLRLFGIRPKPSKKEQIIMSLIQENRR